MKTSLSSERHTRESLSKIGETMNISRETIRKAKIVSDYFVDGAESLQSGKYHTDELYRLAIGDLRVGLYVRVEPWVRDAIREGAKEMGISMGDYLTVIATQIFGGEGECKG